MHVSQTIFPPDGSRPRIVTEQHPADDALALLSF